MNILEIMARRGKEPSSYAGASALIWSIPAVIANPADLSAWAITLTGIAAILAPEAKAAQ